jgi:hypothetical protein
VEVKEKEKVRGNSRVEFWARRKMREETEAKA